MRTVRKIGALTSYRARPSPLWSRRFFSTIPQSQLKLNSEINKDLIFGKLITRSFWKLAEKSTPSSSRKLPLKNNAPILGDPTQIFICIATAGEWNRRMNRVWKKIMKNSLTELTFKLIRSN